MNYPKEQQQKKADAINKILDNPVYLPESGMRVKLHKALSQLSTADLCNLAIIIDLKANKPRTGMLAP